MASKSRERKRQKIKTIYKLNESKSSPEALLEDDGMKGLEELQLEELLFGKPSKQTMQSYTGDLQMDHNLEHLMDSEIFFVDDNNAFQEPIVSKGFGTEDSRGCDNSLPNRVEDPIASSLTFVPVSSSRPAAWHDPADLTLRVSLKDTKQRRKLRSTVEEEELTGAQYESKLRGYYTNANPTPQWAFDARNKVRRQKKRRRRSSSSTDEGSEPDFLLESQIGTEGGELLDFASGRRALKSGILSIERLRDVNYSCRSQGHIHSLEFHPNPRVPVLFTASGDRRLRLFNVDGHTNPHLQTIHIPSLPITGATYHPTGASILLSGPRPFYYTFDLQSGAVTRSAVKSVSVSNGDLSMEVRQFSPFGSLLAIAGKHGYIHLLDWTASGGEQVIGTLKSNSPVTALSWSTSGSHLYSLGRNSEILVWDVAGRLCVNKWLDEGGYGSRYMQLDDNGTYLSIGSSSGFVNVYDMKGITANAETRPKFLKSLGNLTTPISSLSFNASSEILSIASSAKRNQFRLIHLPTLSAFSNWPTAGTPLGTVSAARFSPTSQYIAVGNTQGQALLYSLRHYKGD